MRGLIDRKGEQFAYLQGSVLYTLEGEATGRREGEFIVDLSGKQMWRIVGDAVYSLNGMESIGYFSSEIREDLTR
ncbi:MAG: hypothetical protein P8183_19080 [Anaerolineae bacterium]|jgi:hypothetical protein